MTQKLGQVSEGTIVKINENGSPVDFYVAKQNYEPGLNGAGRTLMVRKDTYDDRAWDNGKVNAYASSDLDSWFNSTYKNMLDADIRSLIGTTKIRYTPGNGNWTVGTLERAIFALSLTELGQSHTYANTEGSALPIASTLRIAYRNGSPTTQWTRSPNTDHTDDAWRLNSDGSISFSNCINSRGSRPAFTLPSTLLVDNDGNVVDIPDPPTLTVPQMVMQGQQATINWTAIEGADSYTLQRKSSADADWTQVYSGANLSYTETVGTWTSLQYRVQAVVDGTGGGWATSGDIQIVSASALVISGQDGDLGTLVNDVPYSISSDQTSLTIDVTVEVNGGEYVSFQATSGQTYMIGVLDLPTGTGNIVITATTTVSSSPVTVARNWTFTKNPQEFSNTGGVGELQQNQNVVWPMTLAEAVRTSMTPWGGNLSTALNLLKNAALYNSTQVPKYSEVSINLANASVGQIINLPKNGAMVPHIVVHIGNPDAGLYDSSCDGVWILQENIVENGQWNANNVNTLNGSTIMTTMQEYVNDYDETVQSAIKTVKIPYCVGNESSTINSGANGLECKIFPLSGYEVGFSQDINPFFPVDGAKLDYFIYGTDISANQKRISSLNGIASNWDLRSPLSDRSNGTWLLMSNGALNSFLPEQSYGYRPCFILPTTFTATYFVDTNGNIQTEQAYTEAGSWLDVWGNAIPAVKMETGSYTGTGTYGQSNPNTLTFSGKPVVLMIGQLYQNSGQFATIMPMLNPQEYVLASPTINGEYQLIMVDWEDNSVSWYSSMGAPGQMNMAGTNYTYAALIVSGGEST